MSCYKQEDNLVIIRKGNHSPARLPAFYLNKQTLSFIVSFTSSCRYNIGSDQTDNNKLFGIGFAPAHQVNSVRFGWYYNPSKDSIEISAYYYSLGRRNIEFITSVGINESNLYTITMTKNKQFLKVGNKATKELHVKSSDFAYFLHPHFGGNQSAPHDIYIKMYRY